MCAGCVHLPPMAFPLCGWNLNDKTILQALKKFFKRLLKIGTEKDKDDVITEIKEYHKNNLYDNEDLHDIADNTTREEEINDYLYTKNYEYDDRDFDI